MQLPMKIDELKEIISFKKTFSPFNVVPITKSGSIKIFSKLLSNRLLKLTESSEHEQLELLIVLKSIKESLQMPWITKRVLVILFSPHSVLTQVDHEVHSDNKHFWKTVVIRGIEDGVEK